MHRVAVAHPLRKTNSRINYQSSQLRAQWRLNEISHPLRNSHEHRPSTRLRSRNETYQPPPRGFFVQVLQNWCQVYLLLRLPQCTSLIIQYAGLADMYSNRMGLSKLKEKDYMQMMKKGAHLSADVKRELDEFDVCHHCKYIYPSYLLTTCKFVSDRQAMPKTT